MSELARVNLHELAPEYDDTDPAGFRAGMARFGPTIGATQMGASLYELPAGQSICPYHYEYPEEEWLIVLEGRVSVRHPGGEDELGRGRRRLLPARARGRAQGDLRRAPRRRAS